MKYLLHIWFVVMILTGVLVGCHRAPEYDSRLTAADKLVYDSAEQAKALLLDINPQELNNANRAYYDLLLTQASYISYDSITAKHDSLIDQALNYYQKHDKELEKLTRANIYKGAPCTAVTAPGAALPVRPTRPCPPTRSRAALST